MSLTYQGSSLVAGAIVKIADGLVIKVLYHGLPRATDLVNQSGHRCGPPPGKFSGSRDERARKREREK